MTMKVQCAVHPDVETALRCGKCGKPICPRCLVQTPVGARCAECAQLRRLPIYNVSASQYLVASAAGLTSAAVIGSLWGLFPLKGLLFKFGLSLGTGYILGEMVSYSVNRKRGAGLQIVAAGSFVLAILISRITTNLLALAQAGLLDFGNFGLISRLSFDIVTRTVTDPLTLIIAVVGILVTVSRLR